MNKKPLIALFTTTIFWGFGFLFVDRALLVGWQPFPLLMMRGLIGGSFMFILSCKNRWFLNKTAIRLGVINGFLFFLGFAFQTTGQQLSTVANTAFITTLNVIFVPIISTIFLKKKIHYKVYIASMIALLGTAILTLQASLSIHFGDILLLICAIFFALQIIYTEKCGEHGDPLSITCIQLLTMGILSLICMPVFKQTYIPSIGWENIFYLAIFSSALASLLQLYGQASVEPSRSSLILSLEAIIGTLVCAIFLFEPLSLSTIIGGLLMFVAVLIVEYQPTSLPIQSTS